MVFAHDIKIKKQYGQHFLRSASVLHAIFEPLVLDHTSSIFEVGCGDGFLTKEILKHPCGRLWIFEIDQEWANYVQKQISDVRMHVFTQNILDVDFRIFEPHAPWTLIANLPYQITFPFLYLMQRNRDLLKEAVVMVQEEVAQKIVKTSGRGYGYPSLFLQHYFEWKLLAKVPPSAFHPAPKIDSRLLYFRPKESLIKIDHEERFWQFIHLCFKQPRRTLKNNLQQTHIEYTLLPEETLRLRAQQMSFGDLFHAWRLITK